MQKHESCPSLRERACWDCVRGFSIVELWKDWRTQQERFFPKGWCNCEDGDYHGSTVCWCSCSETSVCNKNLCVWLHWVLIWQQQSTQQKKTCICMYLEQSGWWKSCQNIIYKKKLVSRVWQRPKWRLCLIFLYYSGVASYTISSKFVVVVVPIRIIVICRHMLQSPSVCQA